MWFVYVCDEEEKELGRQQAPGSCPYCGAKVEAMDVEIQSRLCFLPLCFKIKRKYFCTHCARRLELYMDYWNPPQILKSPIPMLNYNRDFLVNILSLGALHFVSFFFFFFSFLTCEFGRGFGGNWDDAMSWFGHWINWRWNTLDFLFFSFFNISLSLFVCTRKGKD